MYQFKYQQPYEFDDGDSAGGNEILWNDSTHTFEASTDEEARLEVKKFLAEGVINFSGKKYLRNGLGLTFTETREVMDFDEFPHAQE